MSTPTPLNVPTPNKSNESSTPEVAAIATILSNSRREMHYKDKYEEGAGDHNEILAAGKAILNIEGEETPKPQFDTVGEEVEAWLKERVNVNNFTDALPVLDYLTYIAASRQPPLGGR